VRMRLPCAVINHVKDYLQLERRETGRNRYQYQIKIETAFPSANGSL